MTDRDKVRKKIIAIQDQCSSQAETGFPSCNQCPYNQECTFLMAFDDWAHMHKRRKEGDEDLESLVDAVMTISDYKELLEVET